MALDRISGTMTILAFGLLFVSILLGMSKPPAEDIEPFQTTGVSLSGFQATTTPLDLISGKIKRIYSADGTLLWVINIGYILPDDPTYKQGSPYYTTSQTVIAIFLTLEAMSSDALKELETTGLSDPNVYGSVVISDLMKTNKVAGLRVIQETSSGAVQYLDGTPVQLKTPVTVMPTVQNTGTTTGTGTTTTGTTTGTGTTTTGTTTTGTISDTTTGSVTTTADTTTTGPVTTITAPATTTTDAISVTAGVQSAQEKPGLSTGAIVGIVIGILIALILIGLGIYWYSSGGSRSVSSVGLNRSPVGALE